MRENAKAPPTARAECGQRTSTGEIRLLTADGALRPIDEVGTAQVRQADLAPLSEIVRYINEHFGTDFTSEDRVRFFADDMERRLEEREGLREALDPGINPSEETRRMAFRSHFDDTLALQQHIERRRTVVRATTSPSPDT